MFMTNSPLPLPDVGKKKIIDLRKKKKEDKIQSHHRHQARKDFQPCIFQDYKGKNKKKKIILKL